MVRSGRPSICWIESWNNPLVPPLPTIPKIMYHLNQTLSECFHWTYSSCLFHNHLCSSWLHLPYHPKPTSIVYCLKYPRIWTNNLTWRGSKSKIPHHRTKTCKYHLTLLNKQKLLRKKCISVQSRWNRNTMYLLVVQTGKIFLKNSMTRYTQKP